MTVHVSSAHGLTMWHQAPGWCWCGVPHTGDEAEELNDAVGAGIAACEHEWADVQSTLTELHHLVCQRCGTTPGESEPAGPTT